MPAVGAALDVVGHLEQRTLDGEARLQLRVLDYATSDASPIAARRAAPVATPA
jgi:hypothetical protein